MNVLHESRLAVVAERLDFALRELINIIPDNLKDDFEKEAYIAGGSVYSIYNFEQPKDYDVFVRSNELKSKLVTYFRDLPENKNKLVYGKFVYYGTYRGFGLYITDNAISIGKYQIILKDIGDPEEVVSKFDFKHNMHYLDEGEIKAVDDEYNLDTHTLYFNEVRARDIVSTIMRTQKFIDRGFKLPDEELAKMLLKLNETGFNEEELKLLKKQPRSTSFGSGM